MAALGGPVCSAIVGFDHGRPLGLIGFVLYACIFVSFLCSFHASGGALAGRFMWSFFCSCAPFSASAQV